MGSLESLLQLNGLAPAQIDTSKGPTVIVVDDHPVSRKLVARLLHDVDASVNVEQFAEPGRALEWLARATAALVVTDYRMPQMDGIEFVKSVRELESARQTPIMLITVLDDRDVRRRALEAGATDFLNKPIDHDECRARCKNLLESSKDRSYLLEQLSIRNAYIRNLHRSLGQPIDPAIDETLDVTAAGRYVLMENQALYEVTSTLAAIDKLLDSLRNKREMLENLVMRPLRADKGK